MAPNFEFNCRNAVYIHALPSGRTSGLREFQADRPVTALGRSEKLAKVRSARAPIAHTVPSPARCLTLRPLEIHSLVTHTARPREVSWASVSWEDGVRSSS